MGGGTWPLGDDAPSCEVALGHLNTVDSCKALSWEKARLLMKHIEAGTLTEGGATVAEITPPRLSLPAQTG